MKKIIAIIIMLLVVSSFVFSEEQPTYEELYGFVINNYPEERIEDFNKIWNYVKSLIDKGQYAILTIDILKQLLDNPTGFEENESEIENETFLVMMH